MDTKFSHVVTQKEQGTLETWLRQNFLTLSRKATLLQPTIQTLLQASLAPANTDPMHPLRFILGQPKRSADS